MPNKKSVSDKTTKQTKRTKKTSRKKASAKQAAEPTETDNTVTAHDEDNSPTALAEPEAAPPKTKPTAKRATRKTGTKKTAGATTRRDKKSSKADQESTTSTATESAEPIAAAAPPTPEAAVPVHESAIVAKKSLPLAGEPALPSDPLVERSDEAIVIRFPPVAPLPFEGEPPATHASTAVEEVAEPHVDDRRPPVESPSAPNDVPSPDDSAALPAIEMPQPELEPDSPDLDDVDADQPAATAEDAPQQPPTGEKLSASARRRRRRRKSPESAESRPPATPQSRGPEPKRAPEPQRAPQPSPTPRRDTPSASSAKPGAEQALSPSKKRRLRRRRRTERIAGELPDRPARAPEPEHPDEPDDATELEAPPEPPETTARPTPEAAHTDDEPSARPAGKRRRKRGGRGKRPLAERQEPQRPAEPDDEPEEDLEDEQEEAPPPGTTPTKEMIINVMPGEECRIAILHSGKLEEMYIERASAENHVGNIYKGVITNVEPSIQAAFIDFGLGKNGFLHISDLHPQYFPNGGAPAENVGRKMPRRSRPPIQRCLRRGQQVLVQITKEGIGTKGPTLSTYMSIPGRFLVMMPGMRQLGVSRKIEDDQAREKLRRQLDELELPDGMGFIARTAAQERTKRELQSDLKYLSRLWSAVNRRIKEEKAPAELYRESDLVTRTIRDLYSPEIGRIVVDDPVMAQRAREFLRIFSPRSGDVVVEYTDPEPIFHHAGIEAELERLHTRNVPLRSGGSLVIESTEALVAIDVNSGRFRTEDDAEATAYKINLEAADEIARQLRLRDLGGLIIIDFIDMRLESHKRAIERTLTRNLKHHKERAKILRMSQFGIIEMTRQRQRASLTRSVYQDCRHCRGTGLVKTAESVALDVTRSIQLNIIRDSVKLIEVAVSPEVAMLLLNRKRGVLSTLESKHRRTISVRPDSNFGLDHVEVRCYDHRGRPMTQA